MAISFGEVQLIYSSTNLVVAFRVSELHPCVYMQAVRISCDKPLQKQINKQINSVFSITENLSSQLFSNNLFITQLITMRTVD